MGGENTTDNLPAMDDATRQRWALHNGLVGLMLFAYSTFVAPAFSPYSRATAVEVMYGIDYLKQIVQVHPAYYWFALLFAVLSFFDATVLLATTYGFYHRRSWAAPLTYFWALLTISLAILSWFVHFLYVAGPEAAMFETMGRGDSFQRQAMRITSRVLLLAASIPMIAAVIDAGGTIRNLQTKRLATLAEVKQLLTSLPVAFKRRLAQFRTTPDHPQ